MGANSLRVLGLIAVVAGCLALLGNLGIFQISEMFSGLLTSLAGVGFLSLYRQNRARWWAIIPGVILLAMGAVIVTARYGDGDWAGVLTLAGVGLAFVGVLIARRDFWWAIIPAGTMFTLAGVVFAEAFLALKEPGAVLFLGLGLTFALLALVRVGERRLRWALIPAGVLALFGTLILVGQAYLLNYIWPVALIAGGLYFVLRRSDPGRRPIIHIP
jgi:hypothetical protein